MRKNKFVMLFKKQLIHEYYSSYITVYKKLCFIYYIEKNSYPEL